MLETWQVLGKGATIGFCIAAPVGPVGVLCIRRSLLWGPGYGFVSGLGAAAADACYGVLAAGGFSILAQALVRYADWLGVGGSMLMLYLAWGMLRRHDVRLNGGGVGERSTLGRAFASTYFITLANPITIVAFAAMMAGLNLGIESWRHAALFVGAVFVGSTAWWLILSQLACSLRSRLEGRGLRWLDLICGSVLGVFAIGALVRSTSGWWATP